MSIQEISVLLARISTKPGLMGGKPVIREMRFPVTDVLEMLATGMTEVQILEQHPVLEPDDIKAALLFAAAKVNNSITAHAA